MISNLKKIILECPSTLLKLNKMLYDKGRYMKELQKHLKFHDG